MRFIATNFSYGYGPFLRTTELALAVSRRLEANGEDPLRIIVPLVYGEKQKSIMLEEFRSDADRIYLDSALGDILRPLFYANSTYEEALRVFVNESAQRSSEAHRHLRGTLEVVTLSGKKATLNGVEILLEIARAPRLSYDVAPAPGATFGNISEILTAVLLVDEASVSVDRALVRQAIPIADALEAKIKLSGLAHPATFSYLPNRTPLPREIATPPTLPPQKKSSEVIKPGIYVTITGIPGLERLYEEARSLGLMIYSNDPERFPGSAYAAPALLGNENIVLRFARSGWGSVWAAELSEKAVVVPHFDPVDDPEIYFNNICIEKLGLGIVYRGQPLPALIEEAKNLETGIRALNKKIENQFGTLDGTTYMANKIIEHLGS